MSEVVKNAYAFFKREHVTEINLTGLCIFLNDLMIFFHEHNVEANIQTRILSNVNRALNIYAQSRNNWVLRL